MKDKKIVFDKTSYKRINEVRELWVRKILETLPYRDELKTALDIACGAGYFSKMLFDLGFEVTGVDLREENIDLCRKRYPEISFGVLNLDENFGDTGEFDLVLIFGILYHLQSPLQAIQRISRSIKRVAVVSTRVAAGNEMSCFLFREFKGKSHNKSRVAAVPTLPALVSMFHLAGLTCVYRPEEQPDHPQWKSYPGHSGQRHCLVVSRESLEISEWKLLEASDFLKKW